MLRQEFNEIVEFLYCEGHNITNPSPGKTSHPAAYLSYRAGEHLRGYREVLCASTA